VTQQKFEIAGSEIKCAIAQGKQVSFENSGRFKLTEI